MPPQSPLPDELLEQPFLLATARQAGPVPHTEQIHVTAPDRRRLPGIRSVCPNQGSPGFAVHQQLHITAPADNFLELAETLSLVDLAILGDAMVRRGFVTYEALIAAVVRRVAAAYGWPDAPPRSCDPGWTHRWRRESAF